jgi:hypothetical protein
MLRNPRGDNNLEESDHGINISSKITPHERYDPTANISGEEMTQINRKRKHRKNHKSGRSKRVAIIFKHGGYFNMLVKFLEDEPGISMDDRSTKVVTYTCNSKETIPVEFHLPRKSNDVLGLSKWNKRTIHFLNTHGRALEIFSNQGSINWPVKMNARIFEVFLMDLIFLKIRNFQDKNYGNFIIYADYAIWIWLQVTTTFGKAIYFCFTIWAKFQNVFPIYRFKSMHWT